MKASVRSDEKARLAALESYRILDTAPEQTYDDIAALAAFVCGTPMATISLIDGHRQWFKAKTGLTQTETAREVAFCAHTILDVNLMEVPDATLDPRFADNPLVLGEPHIRFYAGAPLMAAEGHSLGAVCVIDREPRHLTEAQKSALNRLARLTMSNLELRRVSAELVAASANVKTLSGMLPICAWCKEIRDDKGYWQNVESFLSRHADVDFSHGVCPKCQAKWLAGVKPHAAEAKG
jgi:GAF domain-containing protein